MSETETVADPPGCAPGAVRCDGSALESCIRRDGQTPGWATEDCALSDGVCVADPVARCVPRACSAGESVCVGATPRRCSVDQASWEVLAGCESAVHCSSDAAECPGGAPCCLASPCTAGASRCNGTDLERCNNGETEWEPLDACPTRELCEAGLATCGTGLPCACAIASCNPGDTRCVGARLERCAASRTEWETVDECETPALCGLGRSADGLGCAPAACAPGDAFCTESGVLQTCRDDRAGFEDEQTCDGPPFCDVVAGSCTLAPCAAGFLRCNGAQIEICRQNREGFDPVGTACETADLCVDDNQADVHCNDAACDAGAFRCLDSGQPQRCNAGHTEFESAGPACRPDLCSEVRQRCDFCVPNRQECTPDLTARRTCAQSGNSFGPLTSCPLGCIPATGTCQSCSVGSYSCNGGMLARCNDGASFTPLGRSSDCDGTLQVTCTGSVPPATIVCQDGCDPGRNACNECSPGEQRCAPGQNAVQSCDDGLFAEPEPCAAGLGCAGGECRCDPFASPVCLGDELMDCNEDQTGFDPAPVCLGSVLRVCEGGASPAQTDCGTAGACQTAAAGSGSCD